MQLKARSLFWFKPSHRSSPEQIVGAALFLLISLSFQGLSGWLMRLSLETEWAKELFSGHASFLRATSNPAWTFYHLLTAFAIWNLWRCNSLKGLKLEAILFLLQFVLGVGWVLSLFVFHESLLALALLLFLCSNTLLAALLYWKKERFSGQALVPSFVWIFYVMGINMAICISNP
jgi:benzodiazapine receptor